MATHRPVSALSLAHPRASTPERAAVATTMVDALTAARSLRASLDGAGVFVLITCLRIEISAECTIDALVAATTTLLGSLPEKMEARSDNEAIHHLLSVAAGLDSPIVGESEVLGQFRRAVESARIAGTIGGAFEQLLSAAINTGRLVRTQLPESPHVSLAKVAADHVAGSKNVAVFGAGAMANAVAGALETTASHVTMYARRPEAVTINVDTVDHINNAAVALAQADAVIAATSAKRGLFAETEVLAAVADRKTPLTIVDLAMPPDFSLSTEVENIEYLGLDQLADLVRPTAVPASVDNFMRTAAHDAEYRYINHQAAGPVIAGLLAEADRIAADEAEKAFLRPSTDSPEAILHDLARKVARRLMHPTVSFLSGNEKGHQAAPLLAEAYELGQ